MQVIFFICIDSGKRNQKHHYFANICNTKLYYFRNETKLLFFTLLSLKMKYKTNSLSHETNVGVNVGFISAFIAKKLKNHFSQLI